MKAALSIVIAGLLIILPFEQVLAQAAQQEAVSLQPAAPLGSAAGLFRIPPLTQNSALLLGPIPLDAPLPTQVPLNAGVDELAPMPLSTGATIGIVVVVALVIVAVAIVICANDSSCNPGR